MVEIETPDPEELGGNVTKPFKFVTGMDLAGHLPFFWPSRTYLTWKNSWLRRSIPQPEPVRGHHLFPYIRHCPG